VSLTCLTASSLTEMSELHRDWMMYRDALTLADDSVNNYTRPDSRHKHVKNFYQQRSFINISKTSTIGTIARKVPACLLTLLYPYSKPRLCRNIYIHDYAPPISSTMQRAAGSATHQAATSWAAAGRCGVSEGSMPSFKSIT